jgi:hypothetical protein
LSRGSRGPPDARPRVPERPGRQDVFGASLIRLRAVIQQQVNLSDFEAGELDVEVEVEQGLQLDGEDTTIPAGPLGQAIVSNDIGALLGLGEMR